MADLPEVPTGEASPETITQPEVSTATETAPPVVAPLTEGTTDVINPQGKLVSLPNSEVENAVNSGGYSFPTPKQLSDYVQEQKYGNTGQQILAGIEKVGKGLIGPGVSGIEKSLYNAGIPGTSPADQAAREAELAAQHPVVSSLAEPIGFIGGDILGTGEAALLGKAGKALDSAGLLTRGGSFVNEVTNHAIKGAFEMTLYQGGEELDRAFKDDPNVTAGNVVSDLGLAAVIGGGLGGMFGAGAYGVKSLLGKAGEQAGKTLENKYLTDAEKQAMASGDMATIIDNAEGLSDKQKKSFFEQLKTPGKNAPEIVDAFKHYGITPHEAMLSDNKIIQSIADGMLRGPTTPSSIGLKNVYSTAYEAASKGVEDALGAGSKLSKAELGNELKKGLVDEIQSTMKPSNDLYTYVKQFTPEIPIGTTNINSFIKDLKLNPDIKRVEGFGAGRFMKIVENKLPKLKTVDELKSFASDIMNEVPKLAAPNEYRAASIIASSLKQLERDSVEKAARWMSKQGKSPEAASMLMDLIEKRKAADSLYKQNIKKIQTLSEQLGKGKIHGEQDAIRFITEKLTPEEVTQKLFSKKDSEFLKFFAKEFPEQMKMMKEYQKGVLRETGALSGEFDPKKVAKTVLGWEPEIQKSIFTPEELKNLKSSNTIFNVFKNFNPSGTSHVTALRDAFSSPTGFFKAWARDWGMEKFIKIFGPDARMQGAVDLAKAAVRGEKAANSAVKSVFSKGVEIGKSANKFQGYKNTEKLKKIVDEYSQNPEKMINANKDVPIEELASSFGAVTARAVQYLASIKPKGRQFGALGGSVKPSLAEQQEYDRQVRIAQNPLEVFDHIKRGTLTPKDMKTLMTVHPDTHRALSQKIIAQVIETKNKGDSVPYKTRMGLSLFLGQPLDDTLTQKSILAAQTTKGIASQGQQPQQMPPAKRSMSGISKMPTQFQTPGQAREAERSKGK